MTGIVSTIGPSYGTIYTRNQIYKFTLRFEHRYIQVGMEVTFEEDPENSHDLDTWAKEVYPSEHPYPSGAA